MFQQFSASHHTWEFSCFTLFDIQHFDLFLTCAYYCFSFHYNLDIIIIFHVYFFCSFKKHTFHNISSKFQLYRGFMHFYLHSIYKHFCFTFFFQSTNISASHFLYGFYKVYYFHLLSSYISKSYSHIKCINSILVCESDFTCVCFISIISQGCQPSILI